MKESLFYFRLSIMYCIILYIYVSLSLIYYDNFFEYKKLISKKDETNKMEIQRNFMNVRDRRLVQKIYMTYEVFILTFINLSSMHHIWNSSLQKEWDRYLWIDIIIGLWDTKKNDLYYHYFTRYLYTEMLLLTFFPFILKNPMEWKIIHLFWIGIFWAFKYVWKNEEIMGLMFLLYTIEQDYYLKLLSKYIYPFKWFLPMYKICLFTFYIFILLLFSIEGIKYIRNSI